METADKSKAQAKNAQKPTDATTLLRADHKRVNELFADFEKSRSAEKKRDLVAMICMELTVHAQLEEEIFYPAVRRAIKDKTLVPEALVEHATLKTLIAQIEGMPQEGEMFEAMVTVLCEYVKHHVKEEEGEIFPQAKATALDMKELGGRLLERKMDLMAEHGV